jgi:hypothetical protein
MMRGFARAAWRQLIAPEWRGPALSLFLLQAVTNALLAIHWPKPGEPPSAAYTSAWGVQTVGLLSIIVALLRAGAGSPRKRWSVDAGFWLYFAITAIPLAAAAAAGWLLGGKQVSLGPIAVIQAASLLAATPLSVWLVAAAVETPLAARPRFEGIGHWLPPVMTLTLPVVVLASVHVLCGLRLIEIAGTPEFWIWVPIDAVVASAVVLIGAALQLAAYRSVARP